MTTDRATLDPPRAWSARRRWSCHRRLFFSAKVGPVNSLSKAVSVAWAASVNRGPIGIASRCQQPGEKTMQLRAIAIAVGLAFATVTAGPALMSSAAFAKDHSHGDKSSQGDHGNKGHDRKDGSRSQGELTRVITRATRTTARNPSTGRSIFPARPESAGAPPAGAFHCEAERDRLSGSMATMPKAGPMASPASTTGQPKAPARIGVTCTVDDGQREADRGLEGHQAAGEMRRRRVGDQRRELRRVGDHRDAPDHDQREGQPDRTAEGELR